MTPLETTYIIVGMLAGIGTVIGMLAGAVRWLTKHYFDAIKAEFKPNGGSSLKDQVNRLENRMDQSDRLQKETRQKIDTLYTLMIDYLGKK